MGRREEVAQSDAGFTFLELLVTLLVLAVALALVGPSIGRGAEGITARADVAAFSAVLRHARERAITTASPYTVVVDSAGHRLAVLAGGPDGEVRETRTLPPRVRIEAIPPPAVTVRFEPQGNTTGGDFRVTSGSITYRVTLDPLTGRIRSARQ